MDDKSSNRPDQQTIGGDLTARERLVSGIMNQMRGYVMTAVEVPGQPPPVAMAFAAAVDAAFGFAEQQGAPRALALDIMFQVLIEREIMRAQMAHQKRRIIGG